jgi:glutaredoxin
MEIKTVAPRAGFEPATLPLTGARSTAELPRNINWRPQLYQLATKASTSDMISSMKKFLLIAILATAFIVGGGVYLFSKNTRGSSQTPTGYEYFYGNSCPHCANVEEFLKTWDGINKISLEQKEVWYNKDNANLMYSRAASCGIARSELGVPLLVTPEGKCIGGDTPIIDYLKGLNLDEKSS